MKNISLVLLFASISLTTLSQQKFKNEFVVTKSGDTIVGTVLIDKKKFSNVKFVDPAGQTHSYETTDIKSFFDKEWGLYVVEKVTFDITRPMALPTISIHGTRVCFLKSDLSSERHYAFWFY